MRGSQKSKRVSWASDVNLCQVRLFLSEECPSLVGLSAQDHLQAKASWMLHSNTMGFDDNLPPGFEGCHSVNQLKNTFAQIPLVAWTSPPRIVLNLDWQVVAGEESKEVETQSQRELRVLEAVYPRASAIPPNPSITAETEDRHFDDQHTPPIPITPVEDEDAVAYLTLDSVGPVSTLMSLYPPLLPVTRTITPGADEIPSHVMIPDVAAAASAALTAIMKSNEQGSLIDHELLVKFLSNPTLIEKLGPPNNPSTSQPVTSSKRLPPVNVGMTESAIPISGAIFSSGPSFPQINGPVPFPSPRPPLHVAKDVNYYKSLIQQHGEERPEVSDQTRGLQNPHQVGINQELINNNNNLKAREVKPKINKPCIYFNSSRGCRHGANCAFQHDASTQQRFSSFSEAQSAKRTKLDSGITGI